MEKYCHSKLKSQCLKTFDPENTFKEQPLKRKVTVKENVVVDQTFRVGMDLVFTVVYLPGICVLLLEVSRTGAATTRTPARIRLRQCRRGNRYRVGVSVHGVSGE